MLIAILAMLVKQEENFKVVNRNTRKLLKSCNVHTISKNVSMHLRNLSPFSHATLKVTLHM